MEARFGHLSVEDNPQCLVRMSSSCVTLDGHAFVVAAQKTSMCPGYATGKRSVICDRISSLRVCIWEHESNFVELGHSFDFRVNMTPSQKNT